MNTQQFVKINPRVKYLLTSTLTRTATTTSDQGFLGTGIGTGNFTLGYADVGHLNVGDVIRVRMMVEVSSAAISNNVAVFLGINGWQVMNHGMPPILTSTSPNFSYLTIDAEMFIDSPTTARATGTNFTYPSTPLTSLNMLTAQAFPQLFQSTLIGGLTSNNFVSITIKFNAVDGTLTAKNLFTSIQVTKF